MLLDIKDKQIHILKKDEYMKSHMHINADAWKEFGAASRPRSRREDESSGPGQRERCWRFCSKETSSQLRQRRRRPEFNKEAKGIVQPVEIGPRIIERKVFIVESTWDDFHSFRFIVTTKICSLD